MKKANRPGDPRDEGATTGKIKDITGVGEV